MKNRNSKHLVILALVLAALTITYRVAAELQRVSAQASMQSLALVSGDFDEDGVPDLISGYAGQGKGVLTLHRGNVDARFPTSPAAQQKSARGQLDDSPFLASGRVLSLPEPPEFIAAGDFNADGHLDIAAAARGSNQLYLTPGNGRGGFGSAQTLELPGRVTAMASGEINRADGLTDVVVGIIGGSGPQALVFESPDGALRGKPEIFTLPAEATALAIGPLDDDQLGDLAVGAGQTLIVVSGRDRKLSLDPSLQAEVKPAAISLRVFSATITDIVIGDFTGVQRPSLALLSDDGAVQMLEAGFGDWSVREALRISRPSGSATGSRLLCARISAHSGQDLVVVDSAQRQLRVVSGGAERANAKLKFEGAPIAALPMQLNGDALSDLVILSSGRSAPTFVMTTPSATFNVTNANDSGPNSLRDAINQANATAGADAINIAIGSGLQTINLLSPLPAITETVTIDGTTQPGFAGAPLIVVNGSSAGVTTNGLIINAANCTIKGLVINGFGHVGILINGAGATGNKVEGCYIGVNAAGTAAAPNGTDPNSFDIDGVDILNGARDNTIGGTTAAARNIISGNRGDGVFIAFGGSNNNLVQGNYIGLNAAGVAAIPNGLAIGAFGVELATNTGLGPQGNIIGGTTPGAGNVISGNPGAGVGIFNANTNNNLVQGNFIGTNAAGAGAVANFQGISIANPPGGSISAKNNLIGGTVVSARNIISGNSFDGVFIAHAGTNGNLVQGNYIGTNPAGAAAIPNIARGVEIAFGAQGNTVGGTTAGARNLLSGNSNDGVGVFNPGTTGNLIQGNYIGTDAAGAVAIANGGVNGFHGVEIAFGTTGNTIGGAVAGAGNLISGNTGFGVGIFNPGTNNNIVQGNLVGLNAAGSAALPGGTQPIARVEATMDAGRVLIQHKTGGEIRLNSNAENSLARSSLNSASSPTVIGNLVGVAVVAGAQNNLIGGTTASARNVLSGNMFDGVFLTGSGTTGNQVLGNYIGTDPTGAVAAPNGFAGVEVAFGTQSNVIGGTTPGTRNIISGNGQYGVLIANPGTKFNTVLGNYIGVKPDGLTALGNSSHGVFFSFSADNNNTIGGPSGAAGNTIAFNGGAGIFADSGQANAFHLNSIFSNGGLGIDLAPAGVTPNDNCDPDPGPNNLQNFPVLTAATSITGSTTIQGTLNSAASTTFVIEFFANPVCDGSGNGEGKTFIGATSVTTAANCQASFNVAFPTSVPVGQFITATATDPAGNTSEFSACVQVAAGCVFAIAPTNQTFTAAAGSNSVAVTAPVGCAWTAVSNDPSFITITSGAGGSGNGTVSYSVTANAGASPRTGTMTIAGQTFTVNQSGMTCAGIISPTSAAFPASGGTNGVTVPAPVGCSWTAVSNDAWITVTSGSPGSGAGTVNYSVAANPGSARTGTMTIAGQIFTVTQAGSGLQYYPLPRPIRLLDTRPGEPACDAPGAPLTGGATRSELARVTCDGITIPADAQAIVGNATVVNFLSAGGFITLYPSGAAQPTVSNLNYLANQIVPNAFTVALGGDGKFNIFATTSTHFIVDITGYYAPPGSGGLFYHPLPRPIRLLDTRAGAPGCDTPGSPLTGGADRTEIAFVSCDGITIPAEAQAVVGNATVVNFVSGPGFITLYPSGATRPTVSNLNYLANQIIPNAFTVGLGSDGAFNIFATSSTDFIADITGYFSPEPMDINGAGLLYYPLPRPIRLLDTRPSEPACDAPGAPLIGGATRSEAARVTCDGITIPANAAVVVGNATVVNFLSGGGFITLYPNGAAQPTVSNLNFTSNQIVPNAFTVGLGSDGKFNIFASATTHFITDLTGFYAP